MPSPIPVFIVAGPTPDVASDWMAQGQAVLDQVNLLSGVVILGLVLIVFSLGIVAALTLRRPGS